MKKSINRKILVIGLLILFLGASATFGVSANLATPRMITQNVNAIQQNIVGKTSLAGNVQISTNTQNDVHPRIATTNHGQTIVVYEAVVDSFTRQVPLVYSTNGGTTWTEAFLFDSTTYTSGSGWLAYPDIVNNPHNDTLWFTMVDPFADQYNSHMAFLPGDITTATTASVYGVSGTGSSNYMYSAGICSANFYMSFATADYGNFVQTIEFGYWCYPDFAHPPVMGGFYYDGQSLYKTEPVAEPEMGSNANRFFSVFETSDHVSIKSNVMDESLMTNGEQQNAMDKYADIEQQPAQSIGMGSDPDVSGSGNQLCVVFVQNGDVKCNYSTCDKSTYIPGYSWHQSTVDTGASTPSVYMAGSSATVAYVKGGNLYVKTSSDGGATWGAATQMNDASAAGKVVADKGAVAIGKTGVAFEDNRNGNIDIYFAPLASNAPDAPQITGPASGNAKKAVDYKFTTTDPQNDQVLYYIDWGDNTNTGWVGPYASGAQITQSHTWAAKGNYTITAQAKDTNGNIGDWGTLTVTMPVSISLPPFFHQLIEKIFEQFPHAFPVLRHLLGY